MEILEINTKLFVNITTINTELKPTQSQENSMFIFELSYLKLFHFILIQRYIGFKLNSELPNTKKFQDVLYDCAHILKLIEYIYDPCYKYVIFEGYEVRLFCNINA